MRSGRIESLRGGDWSKPPDATLAVGHIFGWSVSALPRFPGFLDFLLFLSVRFTDCGLQATVYANFAPCIGCLPWYRLVFGFCSNSLEEQPPLCFNLLILFSFYFTVFCLSFCVTLFH